MANAVAADLLSERQRQLAIKSAELELIRHGPAGCDCRHCAGLRSFLQANRARP